MRPAKDRQAHARKAAGTPESTCFATPTPTPLLPTGLFGYLTISLVLVLSMLGRSGFALDYPSESYQTIETEHFLIHHESSLAPFAERVARICEDAHQTLTPLLHWKPKARTHVVVRDDVDMSNGSANVFGRNTIVLYALPPDPQSVLGYYDDWLRVLIYHEYVHILHLDTVHGIPHFLNTYLWQQVFPNQILPRWYIEGLATYFESEETRGGRIDGSLFQMWLRMSALGNDFLNLGQVTGYPRVWPSGNAAYLYGSHFIDYLARRHGAHSLTEFNHIYGGRLIPFSLNQAYQQITGETLDEAWTSWASEEKASAIATAVVVRARGETKIEKMTSRGVKNAYPRIRPHTHEVTFFASDFRSRPHFASIKGKSTEHLVDVQADPGGSSWSPNGDTLYFAQIATDDPVYRHRDLHAFDSRSQTVRRLTWGERAADPAASPDGAWIAYVRAQGGTNELVVRSTSNPTDIRTLIRAKSSDNTTIWQQISMPAWSPDSKRIAISWWQLETGQRDLWTIDVAGTQAPRQWTNDFSLDLDPHFGEDGLLYFASDRTGIFNIYAIDLATRKTLQLSDVIGGVFAPLPSPNREWIYVSTYSSDGYDIGRFRRPAVPKLAKSESRRVDPLTEYPDGVSEEQLARDAYQSWRWLLPERFMIDFGIVAEGTGLGGTFFGGDPIGHHSYALTAAAYTYDDVTPIGKRARIDYSYGALPWSTTLSASVSDTPTSRGFFANGAPQNYGLRVADASLGVYYPLVTLWESLGLRCAMTISSSDYSWKPEITHRADDPEPTEPNLGWHNRLSLGLSYGDAARFPYSVSPEDGIRASTTINFESPILGSDKESATIGFRLQGFLSNPWVEDHVFAAGARGAINRALDGTYRAYVLGGMEPQNILRSAVLGEIPSEISMLGYKPGRTIGSQYALFEMEYRLPIWQVNTGFSTLPVYLRELKGRIYSAYGGAYNGDLIDAELLSNIGGEMQLGTVLGYGMGHTLRLGFARGLADEGISEFYFIYGGGY